jgi:hypothetical protein
MTNNIDGIDRTDHSDAITVDAFYIPSCRFPHLSTDSEIFGHPESDSIVVWRVGDYDGAKSNVHRIHIVTHYLGSHAVAS